MNFMDKARALGNRFFGIDYRSLVLLRVGVALVILIDLAHRAKDFTAHYTDLGVLPIAEMRSTPSSFFPPMLHLWSGSWEWQAFLFLASGVLGMMLLLGYKTRLVSFLSWILLVSLQARNPLIRDGGDILLKIVLFWGIWLPWGEYFSLDSAFSKMKEKISATYASVATAAVMLQVSFVYIFTALLKNGVEWWGEWTATEFALRIDQLTTPFGKFLLQFPVLLQWLTAGVYIFEFAVPFLFFFPLFMTTIRTATVLGLWLMHLGFGLSLRLGVFPILDAASVSIFIPTKTWDWVWKKLKTNKRTGLSIYYDGDCGFCYKMVRVLKTFFLFPEVKMQPAQSSSKIARLMTENNSWVVIDSDGVEYVRYNGVIAVAAASPLLSPFYFLLALAPIKYLGELIYRIVAGHRKSVCVPVKPKRQWSFMNLRVVRWGASAVGVVLIIYTFAWNVMGITNDKNTVPQEVRFIGQVFQLDQFWSMFAPFPLRDDGWFVMAGTLANGEVISLFQNPGGELSLEKPEQVSKTYSSQRTRKYFLNFWMERNRKERPRYALYLCKDWNKDHSGDEFLKKVEITFMRELTLSDRTEAPVVPVKLLEFTC